MGTLSCDAGIPTHISTTVAAPVLIPALCNALVCTGVKLEFKREVLAALWNTVSEPPSETTATTTSVRDEFLWTLYGTPHVVKVLFETTPLHDVDAMRPSVLRVNAMHRRLDDSLQLDFPS